MLCNQPESTQPQNLQGIEDNKAREKVIDFIITCLPEFQSKYASIENENGLTQELVFILDNNAREQLPLCAFFHEHIENTSKGNSPQVDIGVRSVKGVIIEATQYANNKPFIVFEAKRLNSGLDKGRKKEYVVGSLQKDGKYKNSGGIERFKKEIHGQGLTYVGMIGYLQTEDFDTWLNNINEWIDGEITKPSSEDLVWSTHDRLSENKRDNLYHTYDSKHKSKTKEVNIYHIWVDVKVN